MVPPRASHQLQCFKSNMCIRFFIFGSTYLVCVASIGLEDCVRALRWGLRASGAFSPPPSRRASIVVEINKCYCSLSSSPLLKIVSQADTPHYEYE